MGRDHTFRHRVDGGSLEVDAEHLRLRDRHGSTAEFPADSVGELKTAVDAALNETAEEKWFHPEELGTLAERPPTERRARQRSPTPRLAAGVADDRPRARVRKRR